MMVPNSVQVLIFPYLGPYTSPHRGVRIEPGKGQSNPTQLIIVAHIQAKPNTHCTPVSALLELAHLVNWAGPVPASLNYKC